MYNASTQTVVCLKSSQEYDYITHLVSVTACVADADVWLHPPQHRDGMRPVGDLWEVSLPLTRLTLSHQSLPGRCLWCLPHSQQNLSGWCFYCSPFSHYYTKVCIVVVWCLSHSISAKSIWLMFPPLSFLSLSYQGLPGSCLNYHLPVCHARQPWGKCVKVFGTETICIFCKAFFDRSSEQASHVFLEWVQATTKNMIIFTS